MNFLKVLTRIQPEGFWHLLKLAMPNLLFLGPTYRATKNCMAISTQHFGRKHYQNGQANAFRHALWNVLIAKYSAKSKNQVHRALKWAKKITDWHEETFFSKELPMKMDYHNNEVGRKLFKENVRWTEEKFIVKLRSMTENAVKIQQDSKLNQFKNQLVFITDDH
jgi:hypothetical protein